MKKVYVVIKVTFDWHRFERTLGVFGTEARALKAIKKAGADNTRKWDLPTEIVGPTDEDPGGESPYMWIKEIVVGATLLDEC